MTNELTFTLTPDEANIIGQALGRLPYDQVHALLAKIIAQATAQEAASADEQAQANKAAVLNDLTDEDIEALLAKRTEPKEATIDGTNAQ